MKKCPLCGGPLEPSWSTMFNAWSVTCLHWTARAIDKDRATRGWEEMYVKWLKKQINKKMS